MIIIRALIRITIRIMIRIVIIIPILRLNIIIINVEVSPLLLHLFIFIPSSYYYNDDSCYCCYSYYDYYCYAAY